MATPTWQSVVLIQYTKKVEAKLVLPRHDMSMPRSPEGTVSRVAKSRGGWGQLQQAGQAAGDVRRTNLAAKQTLKLSVVFLEKRLSSKREFLKIDRMVEMIRKGFSARFLLLVFSIS